MGYITEQRKDKPLYKPVVFNLKMKLITAISVLIVGIFVIFSLFFALFYIRTY
ncbi:hypothetical protein RWE15_08365 [Virgibacillus halophilus]|uniref:Uncharacterized protein n=1 Tax=Tigheibacillus halophilus TaxID=361280 RepID=A0ABU5C575_9BACI|nr:hypothetical protein [Virgibacillus halophilus]